MIQCDCVQVEREQTYAVVRKPLQQTPQGPRAPPELGWPDCSSTRPPRGRGHKQGSEPTDFMVRKFLTARLS